MIIMMIIRHLWDVKDIKISNNDTCENRNTEEPEETGTSDGYSEQGA